MFQSRQGHDQHAGRHGRNTIIQHIPVPDNIHLPPDRELQKIPGRSQDPTEHGAQRDAPQGSQQGQEQALIQVQAEYLTAGTAPALDHGDLIPLHVIHLGGNHEQEGSQQDQHRHL